jgi:hypothetical protein
MNLKFPLETFLTSKKKVELYFNLGQQQKLIHFCEIFPLSFNKSFATKCKKWTQLEINVMSSIFGINFYFFLNLHFEIERNQEGQCDYASKLLVLPK